MKITEREILRLLRIFTKKILKANTEHFGSNFYLGTLLLQNRKFELAKSLLYKATQINPKYAVAHK